MQLANGLHPDSNSSLTLLTTVVRNSQLISGIFLVGLLLTIAFFIQEEKSFLTKEALRIKKLAGLAATIWLMSSLGNLFVEIANILNSAIVDSFDLNVIRSFLTQTALGNTYAIGLISGLIVFSILPRIKRTTGAIFALLITLIGVLAPIFQSHAPGAGNHTLAIGSLVFHVAFISLWVGGVLGLILISPKERELSIPRFSSLALWASIIVLVSGAVNAWARLNFVAAWKTDYAYLVIAKAFFATFLIALGAKHRKYIAQKMSGSKAVFELLIGELIIMTTTVFIGGLLATTDHPDPKVEPIITKAISLTGMATPKPPTISRLFWAYIPDGLFLGLLILATALYIKGVLVLSKRGDKWPVGRTVAFVIGIGTADYATSGGLGVYAHFAFSYHMVAHMVLSMMVPIALVLSAPITLALRTLPQGRNSNERGIRGVLITLLNSRYLKVISNPITALAIFDGSLFVLYMTPLFGKLMNSHSGHLFMNIHFILAGALFFHVIIGVDPNPWKVPHIVRIIILFAAMSIHAFFSIALLATSTLIDGGYFAAIQPGWIANLLEDQHRGAALGWAMGEIPILLALVATFIQWVREDKKEGRRIDRAEDRAAAMGEDDDLARYNKMLSELSRTTLKKMDEKGKG